MDRRVLCPLSTMANVKMPPARKRRRPVRPKLISPLGLAAAAVMVVVGLALVAFGWRDASKRNVIINPVSVRVALGTVARSVSRESSWVATAEPVPYYAPTDLRGDLRSRAVTVAIAKVATSAARASSAAKPAPAVAADAGPPLYAYAGLGSWVDLYDDRAWNDPAAAVKDMAKHGVRTLYIETSRYTGPALNQPAALSTFIKVAHANHMRVVAWYLPYLESTGDYARIAQTIRFRTSDGQKFDSFALDIETGTSDIATRNRGLDALSRKIRALVGPSYPLGAIIPSPIGMQTGGSWSPFPYTALAKVYDVFVPMSYYTYHGSGADNARSDTLANVRIIRAQPGCATIPIHLIGGISDNSSAGEVQAFVRAARQTKVFGASLYGWVGTSSAMWTSLKAVKP
jgi:hypothetical protein